MSEQTLFVQREKPLTRLLMCVCLPEALLFATKCMLCAYMYLSSTYEMSVKVAMYWTKKDTTFQYSRFSLTHSHTTMNIRLEISVVLGKQKVSNVYLLIDHFQHFSEASHLSTHIIIDGQKLNSS